MAGLKIFISSTCYDLIEERSQVRNLLLNLGHDPILSDHNDVYYDNYEHTHVSCIRQVSNADMVILLIGSRYGGVAIDDALKEVNLDLIQERLNTKIKLKELVDEMKKRSQESLEAYNKDNTQKKIRYGFSITHFEILRAIQEDIPIYVFVKDKVWNFNELYTYNKDKIEDLTIPSIDKSHSKYLFEFIEILKNRKLGNSIQPYSNFLDIESALKKQFAEKLKTLMDERKKLRNQSEQQQDYISKLTDRFDDLKEAILSVLPKGNEREVAKGVIKYRRLIASLSFIMKRVGIDSVNINNTIATNNNDFIELLKNHVNIEHIFSTDISEEFKNLFNTLYKSKISINHNSTKTILSGENFFFVIENTRFIENLKSDWQDFILINDTVRKTIVEVLNENGITEIIGSIKYIDENLNHFTLKQFEELINSKEMSESTLDIIKSINQYFKKHSDDDDDQTTYSISMTS